jgi:hypothetical protein
MGIKLKALWLGRGSSTSATLAARFFFFFLCVCVLVSYLHKCCNRWHQFFFIYFFMVQRIKPMFLYTIGKHSATYLHPQPGIQAFAKEVLVKFPYLKQD